MRRGTILLSVMMIVVIAALIGATAMYVAQAQASTASLTLRRTQARALAWSGVQAVMSELAGQREALLDGDLPILTEEWELYQDGAARGVVRLVALGGGNFTESEAARVNLNTATPEMLSALGMSKEAAAGVVAEREKGTLQSVEAVAGLVGAASAHAEAATDGTDEGTTGAPSAATGAGLIADLLTVWSFDPNIQAGVGEGAGEHRGKLRVNLDMEWSDKLKDAVEERFGEGSSGVLKGLMDGGSKFKSMADVVGALQQLNVPPKDWAPILDALTTSEDPFLPGKIDLNRAPAAVLACVPGFDGPIAEQIVEKRGALDAAGRASVAWPLIEGLVTAEQFKAAVDHLTTRSMQWRVRVEAGVARAEDSGAATGDTDLRDCIVVEAVIDVASERPRVAYLRDITMMDAAGALFEELLAEGEVGIEDEMEPERALADLIPELPGEGVMGPNPEDMNLLAEAGLRMPGLNVASGAAAGSGTRGNEGGGGSGEEDLSEDWGFGDLDLFGDEDARSGPEDLARLIDEEVPEPAPAAGIDRRLGRWTTGKGGAK